MDIEREQIEDLHADPPTVERGNRTTMLRLEAFLSARSRGFVIVVGLLLLALISLIDGVTGRFDVTLFYFLPVAIVTFSRGKWMGALFAGIATLGWAGTQIVNHVTSLDNSVTYWNAITHFYAYALVVMLIAPMREAVLFEREAAEKEAAAAEQLRALMELRDAAERATWDGSEDEEDPALSELREALHALDREWSSNA
jgi:K+-sensing histidine kinase KdpD